MDPSSLHCHPQIWQISRNPGSLQGYKLYHYTNDEAFQPPNVDPTFMSYIYKMFDNLHMQWMGVRQIHHYSIITAGGAKIWQISRNLGSLLSFKLYHYTSDEAFQPPKVDPTFMSYIYKIFENLHIQWMGVWIHHHSIVTPRFGKLA